VISEDNKTNALSSISSGVSGSSVCNNVFTVRCCEKATHGVQFSVRVGAMNCEGIK